MAIKLTAKSSNQFDSFTYKVSKAKESKAITAKELINMPNMELTWVVEQMAANGLITLISAHPKVGKTTLLYHLLESLLNNSSFLDRSLDFEGSILLLSEEPYPILKAKFTDLGLDTDRIFILQRSVISDWNEGLNEIKHHIKEKNVKLVIVDTLAAFWNVKDENSAGGITGSYQLFQRLIQRHNIAGILIHHLRKGGGKDGEGVRGSTAILAAVDVTIEMERDSDTKRKISIQSRYASVTIDKFIIELRDGKYSHLGSKNEFSSASVIIRSLEIMKKQPDKEFKPEEMRELLSPKPGLSTIKKSLDELLKRSEIRRKGKGSKGDPWLYSFQAIKPRKITQKQASGSVVNEELERYQEKWTSAPMPAYVKRRMGRTNS